MMTRHIRQTAAAIVVAALALAACGRPHPKVDCDFPDRDEFATLMADLLTVDAMLQADMSLTRARHVDGRPVLTEACYHTILERYGMTKPDFDSIMNWYATDPELLSEVYDEVVAILSRREASFKRLKMRKDSLTALRKSIEDSIATDCWHHARVVRLPLAKADTFPRDLTYRHSFDSARGGVLKFKAGFVFHHTNATPDTVASRIVVAYADSTADTLTMLINARRRNHTHSIDTTFALRDTTVSGLCGTLIDTDDKTRIGGSVTGIALRYMPFDVTDNINPDEILLPLVLAK